MKPGLRFTRESVFVCYFEATKDVSPTLEELDDFEKELFKRYNALLGELMPQSGLDPTEKKEKSLVLSLAQMSGLDKPRLQVKNACVFLRRAMDSFSPTP